MSPNQGQVWNLMAGGIGNPLIVDTSTPATNVNPAAGPTPNGAQGRIVLAVPAPTGNAAAGRRSTRAGSTRPSPPPTAASIGLFVTKDFGQNWTKVRIPTLPAGQRRSRTTRPSRPTTSASPITRSSAGTARSPARATTTSPWPSTRPIPTSSTWAASRDGGQTGLIRVDATNLWDAHALVAFAYDAKDGGASTWQLDRPGHDRHQPDRTVP